MGIRVFWRAELARNPLIGYRFFGRHLTVGGSSASHVEDCALMGAHGIMRSIGISNSRYRWLLQNPCLSFSDIGRILGVSRERVRQVHKNFFPDTFSGEQRGGFKNLLNARAAVGITPKQYFEYHHAERRCWGNIKSRCLNPNHPKYDDYGGRGITICDEWKDDFWSFYAYVGSRPRADLTIERINNDRGYEPGNVKWATWKEQNNNRRKAKRRRKRKPLLDGSLGVL